MQATAEFENKRKIIYNLASSLNPEVGKLIRKEDSDITYNIP